MNSFFDLAEVKPIIGILTAKKKNGSMAGNGPLFIKLQTKLRQLGAVSVIFTLEDVTEHSISGYTFDCETNRWRKIIAPFPDLIYNRIPFRKTERDKKAQDFFSKLKEKNIPFFNPCYIDKYELYLLMKKDAVLKKHLPDTIMAKDKQLLSAFIKKYRTIYLKPAHSSRGKGIYKASLAKDSTLKLEGIKHCCTYASIQEFWQEWENALKQKSYLAQEEITSQLYQEKRFDFRILAHADNHDYNVTGVGIRQSTMQNITTHIPAGGTLLPYHLIQNEQHDEFIKKAVTLLGKALSQEYGFFGEFSIDAGLSQTGQYYIYEANSKPMSFDEVEIENRKIDQLCKLFLQLTSGSI